MHARTGLLAATIASMIIVGILATVMYYDLYGSPASTSTVMSTEHGGITTTSTNYSGNDSVCREEGYSTSISGARTTCVAFNRSSGTAGEWVYSLLGSRGTLSLNGIGDFHYFQFKSDESSIPTDFSYYNVRFSQPSSRNLSTSSTSAGGQSCFPPMTKSYDLIFQDTGEHESISSCITGNSQTWELHLSSHAPRAGLLIVSDGTVYFLVSRPDSADQAYVVTDNPASFFTRGHYSRIVNFSETKNSGDTLAVGPATTFRYDLPSNLETKDTTIGGTSTRITITAEYQCGFSLGQRRFFHAEFSDGSPEVSLDYCLVLNSAIQMMQLKNNPSMNWSLWQASLNSGSPTVAIHMSGTGENVKVVELWAGASSSMTTITSTTISTTANS